ncbi:MAG: hypothetical protein IJ187_02500 [Neisseriaceae bacterium]|nr:hypothetical protein [Neisseriaceae bacterium]
MPYNKACNDSMSLGCLKLFYSFWWADTPTLYGFICSAWATSCPPYNYNTQH